MGSDAPDGLTLRSRYWDDLPAREAFKRFLVQIHGLDLSLWEQRGFWDDAYTPFSLFDGDRIVSSVCLYSTDMVLDGRRCRLGQISGVGTAPERRRRGLNRWLTERALEWAAPDHEGCFLFADDEAVPFYRRCGWEPVVETAAALTVEPAGRRPGLRRLDPDDASDLALVYDLASRRRAVSDVVGVHNARLTMFHFLYGLRRDAYQVPDLDVVVFFRVDGLRLTLFDVVGPEVPPLSELHPYLAVWRHDEIEFRFVPDLMGVTATRRVPIEGNHTHVAPGFRRPAGDWQFPHTAHA
jgi:GNAT superfamily N-acetyltransferase